METQSYFAFRKEYSESKSAWKARKPAWLREKVGVSHFFEKNLDFFQKRCWQNSLGMILYMSCQRDSDAQELKKLISKPKTSDFDWNFGFKKKLKKLWKKCLTSWKQCDIINEFTSVNETHRTLKIEQHESKQSWWYQSHMIGKESS